MPRLFVAIDLPEEQRRELEIICHGLPAATRWITPKQIHLTLRFIGEVDATRFHQIKETLADLHFSPFPLRIRGLGLFPPKRQPNILWAGVAENHELIRLQEAIERHLVQLGLTPEKRKFHPHLTIARLPHRLSPEILAGYLKQNDSLTLSPFQVDNFRLYSSKLSGNGAIHRIEESFAANEIT